MSITIEGNPIDEKIPRLIDLASRALEANRPAAASAIADAERAFRRVIKRAEAASDSDWERVEIVQQRGPTIGFNGKLLGETSFTTNGNRPMKVDFEIWETKGGALIAVSATEPVDGEGLEIANVTVVEPEEDALAMRCKAMSHFDYHDRARNMARKMGWSISMEVE